MSKQLNTDGERMHGPHGIVIFTDIEWNDNDPPTDKLGTTVEMIVVGFPITNEEALRFVEQKSTPDDLNLLDTTAATIVANSLNRMMSSATITSAVAKGSRSMMKQTLLMLVHEAGHSEEVLPNKVAILWDDESQDIISDIPGETKFAPGRDSGLEA